MKQRILVGITLAGLVGLLLAFAVGPRFATAKPAKNLKVLPADLDKKQVKKIMKQWAKALGVECDYCHDPDDMAKETKKKEVARKMYKMMQYINSRHMKEYDDKVTCKTCHQGREEPEK
jgi:hypothetical protein